MVLSLATQKGWIVHHIDVKSSLLNRYLDEKVYLQEPQSFEVKGKEKHVYRLKKVLYGLKKVPRAWYIRINGYFSRVDSRGEKVNLLYTSRKEVMAFH